MEAKIIYQGESAIVPASHVAFLSIKRLAAGRPLNKPFFIKDGVIAELRADGCVTVEIREGGMIDYEYAILDGERGLVEAYINEWTHSNH